MVWRLDITLRHTRKIIYAPLICLIWLLFVAPAFADEPLSVTALITPGDMTEPGEATFTVTLVNNGRAQATNIRIAPNENHAGASVEPLNAGDTYVFETQINVTQKQLDAGRVDLIVSYRSNGTNYKKKLAASVKRVSVLARVNISRQMPDCAREGDVIEIVYLAENVGLIAVSELYITDAPGGYISAQANLAPGESRRFTNFVRVGKTETSQPTARYISAETGMSYKQTLPARALTLAADNVSLEWQTQSDTLVLLVRNNGLFTYSELRLSVAALSGAQGVPDTLRPGKSFIGEWHGVSEGEYTAVLRARDDAGNDVSFTSPKLTVSAPPQSDMDAPPIIHAEAQYARISVPGQVGFNIAIDGGASDIYGARVTEQTLGALRTLHVLPAGKRTLLTVFADVISNHVYSFSLAYNDAAGETRTVRAAPVTVTIAAGGAAPASLEADGKLHGVKGLSNLPMLIVIACAILITLVALLAFMKRRERVKKRKRRPNKPKRADTGEYKPVRLRRKQTYSKERK